MSRIAIVSALHAEVRELLKRMPDERPRLRAGREFWIGHLDGHEVVVVLSRVGKVAAATTATLLISELDVGSLVFTGTAGGLHVDARVGDVVIADALLQHDLDASPLFPRHEVPLYGVDRFRADPVLSDALASAAQSVLEPAQADASSADAASLVPGTASSTSAPPTSLPASSDDDEHRIAHALFAHDGVEAPRVLRGLVVSGDRFVATAVESAALRERLPRALAVEMEGAAVAQVCHDFGVPFAVVRTISDRADDAAHVDFVRFVDEVASRYSVAIVRRWLRDRVVGS